jgi:hypothetical protein
MSTTQLALLLNKIWAKQLIDPAFSTVAKIEATHSLLPRAPNSLIPVGIPSPLLHNPLNSFANTRTSS